MSTALSTQPHGDVAVKL